MEPNGHATYNGTWQLLHIAGRAYKTRRQFGQRNRLRARPRTLCKSDTTVAVSHGVGQYRAAVRRTSIEADTCRLATSRRVKLEFHGTDPDNDTDIRAAPIV